MWWDYTTRFSEECTMDSQQYGEVRLPCLQPPPGAEHSQAAV